VLLLEHRQVRAGWLSHSTRKGQAAAGLLRRLLEFTDCSKIMVRPTMLDSLRMASELLST
jgi:hypothetical protein